MMGSILHIGFDDTDSVKSMCTTYLAFKVVDCLRKESVVFQDFPRLIRFNPNIPWKTRGNGAVSFSIKTSNNRKIKRKIKNLVLKYSDIKNGANPGLVFFEKTNIPKNFSEFSKLALWKLINRKHAKRFASENGIEVISRGNGQGIVGAIGAIGYEFEDYTFELLSYRKKSHFGKPRKINTKSVKEMQEKTYPNTFNSYDDKKNRVLITPRGPDPVFFGVRGEDVKTLLCASKMIQTSEKIQGYMTFKTNQATGDHLKNEIDILELTPYTSGTITGTISKKPSITRGGHVIFSLNKKGKEIFCAVYKPTKLCSISMQLIQGDRICVGGGIRKATKLHPRTLNVEFIKIIKLKKNQQLQNPLCMDCSKTMKSKGQNQGFECIKCGKTASQKTIITLPRKIKSKLYIPTIGAHRHLTRPYQRLNQLNKNGKFNHKTKWYHFTQTSGE